MKISRILIIKGQSQYDVLREFVDEIVDGFISEGIEIDIYDFLKQDDISKKEEIYKTDYDMIISFYGISEKLLEKINHNKDTLFLLYLMDHPYYRHDWLMYKHKHYNVACVDIEHCNYIKKYYPNIEKTFYIPHGGSIIKECIPYTKKKIDISFIGTLGVTNDYEELKTMLPPILWDVLERMVQRIIAGCKLPTHQVVIEELNNAGIVLDSDEMMEFMQIFARADSYIRIKDRERLMLYLAQKGYHVNVYGNGWDRLKLEQYSNIHIYGNALYSEVLSIISDSKIVINKMPLFWAGSHDRVFTTMLGGSVCLTDRSSYYEKIFDDNRDVCFYDINNLDSMRDKIEYLLNNPEAASKIAESGKQKAMQDHSWKNRVRLIIEQYL